ncbi:hypothetical protein DS745_05615 [Anaerobacillus alkaliphilus]|uniref:SbsC C-terminal domain-containing protein n=1 Tax=Anaerobacillus alkaliphilus TaxID=1548597 RepID=A0A4Q0VVI5_9BACI|nr:hypothetical protein [Anaerobacillus alkaliphilus]RXJ02787.1 hypothetical protein DS745_05615 [Anaerobacillus alkaliphilus]
MVMKSLKTKIAVGVVSFSLVAGVGTVFANVNAAEQLRTWYDVQFGLKTTAISDAVDSHRTGAKVDMDEDKAKFQNDSVNAIKKEGINVLANSSADIGKRLGKHTKDMTTESTKILLPRLGVMDSGFSSFLSDERKENKDFFDGVYAQYTSELTSAVNDQGVASEKLVEDGINLVSNTSNKALTEAVNLAKSTITSELNRRGTSTQTTLFNTVNKSAEDTMKKVTSETNEKVVKINDDIRDLGSRLTSESLAELDKIVLAGFATVNEEEEAVVTGVQVVNVVTIANINPQDKITGYKVEYNLVIKFSVGPDQILTETINNMPTDKTTMERVYVDSNGKEWKYIVTRN